MASAAILPTVGPAAAGGTDPAPSIMAMRMAGARRGVGARTDQSLTRIMLPPGEQRIVPADGDHQAERRIVATLRFNIDPSSSPAE